LYLYLRKAMYVEYAVKRNRVDPSIDRHYQAVDTAGVIDMSYYDLLVLRARYSHSITRTQPPTKASTSDDSDDGPEPARRPAQVRQVTEDQTKAHERFDDFNQLFADFVRRVDPTVVLPKSRVASGSRRGESKTHGASDDGVDEDSALRSPLESPFMLTEFRARAKMLEQLYSTSHLTLMVCYYDFVMKNGLVDVTGLAQFGASDIAADVISFLNIFTTDAILHAGGRPWGHTKKDLDLRSSHMLVSTDDDQKDSHARIGAGRRSRATVANEVEIAKAMRSGRRFLLNSNKLLGNNLRQFLTDQQVDWLSLDDVLDVLQHEIGEQAKQLQRAIAKDPVLARSDNPGGDVRRSMVAMSNPILNVDDDDEADETGSDEDRSVSGSD
jgi:hypothetical protein